MQNGISKKNTWLKRILRKQLT